MINNHQLDAFAQHFPTLFQHDELALDLQKLGNLITLPAGKPICLEGDNCTHLAFVLQGTGRIYKLGESGREITLYRIEDGECCILTLSCILGNRSFPAFAVSETELTAIMLPASKIQNWMNDHVVWREYAWNLIAERLGNVISLVEEVTFRRMDERLNNYLVQLQAQADISAISITHQQIAADLGTSREVISRLLKDKQQQGQIELGRGLIRFNSEISTGQE